MIFRIFIQRTRNFTLFSYFFRVFPTGGRFTPLHLSIAELLNIIEAIYRLQSNRYLITFKDADHCGRHLKC